MKRTEINYYGTKVDCIYIDYRDNEGNYTVELMNVLIDHQSLEPLINENVWDELQHLIYEQSL